ncbi:MAG: aminotransferase class I/II-fold pyridoxal phosphate-dependent enzyme [Candidatus Thorarchaeota archaeon]
MSSDQRLRDLRVEVEQVTLDIVRLVGRRDELSRYIAEEKLRSGLPLANREVERNLRTKIVELCQESNQDSSFALGLLNELIANSIRIQEKHFKPSVPLSAYHIFMKAKKLERDGKQVIHLEVGEPDFGPPSSVMKSISDSVLSGLTGYTESAGIIQLRNKIAAQSTHRFGQKISPDEVVITNGGRLALYASLATSLKPGDEVIVIDPSYPAYRDCIKQIGGRPIHLSTESEDGWIVDINKVEDAINQTTKIIVLNSPCNPTGKVLEKETIDSIVDLSIENDIQILSDEVYSDFVFSPFASLLEYPQCNKIVVNSFSKSYGMTGFRLGYAISDVRTIKKISQFQSLSLTSVSEFIQYAGLTALDCKKEVHQYSSLVKMRTKFLCDSLEQLPVSFHKPDGGFYIFPKIEDSSVNSIQFANRLLSEHGIAVVPGIAYGQNYSQYFRICLCQPVTQLRQTLEGMKEGLC